MRLMVFFVISALTACDLADAVGDRLEDEPGSTTIDGGPDTVPADPNAPLPAPGTTPAPPSPTPPAPPPPAPPPAPVSVTLDVRLRYVAANGQLLAEADMAWAASGGGNLVVDIEAKSDLAFPTWTDIATGLAPNDVGSVMIDARRQDWHFRAVVSDLDDQRRTSESAIVTIRQ